MMNMAEAKEKLMSLAKGEYHTVQYKLGDHGGGHVEQECSIYITDIGHFKGVTWEGCFYEMELAINIPKGTISEDLPISQQEGKK